MNDYDGEQDKHISAWDLPFVEDERKAAETTTNALNRRSNWKYEPPENQVEEEEEFAPPTAQEIESIREAAQSEVGRRNTAERTCFIGSISSEISD